MKYWVLDEDNVYKEIDDSAIEEYINNGGEIKREIVQAMGQSHREEYLKYLYPVLNHPQYDMRSDAAQGIFNLNGKKGLQKLKAREAVLDESEFMDIPSEKGVLRAMILRIEEGIDGVKKYFLSDDGYEIVKYDIPFCYRSGYNFKEEDVELLCFILENAVKKSVKWIKDLEKEDYNELIYFTLESVWMAGEETGILKGLSDDLSERILIIFKTLIDKRVNNDTKEIIAETAKYMKRDYAISILQLLKNKVSGDAKREYKKALKYWGIGEEEL